MLIHLHECLKHRKTALRDATALTDTIMSRLVARAKQGVIEHAVVHTTTLEVLEHFDHFAATYYQNYRAANGETT
jgi:hypothetical protein